MKFFLSLIVFFFAAEFITPQQFSLSTDYYNLYRERSQSSNMDIVYRKSDLISTFNFSSTKLSFNLGYSNSSFSLNHQPDDIRNNFTFEQKYSSISFFTAFNSLFLDSKITLNSFGQKFIYDYSLRFGFHSLKKDNFETDFSFSKVSYPFAWNLNYQSEGFDINTGNTFYLAGLNASAMVNSQRLKISYEKNIINKENYSDLYTMTSRPEYENINLELSSKEGVIPFSLSAGNTTLKMRSALLMNSIQFSTVKLTDYSNFKVNGDVTVNLFKIPFTFYLQYNLFRGKLIGNAESWPFADLIQSLVANRINFKAEGTVKLLESSFSALFKSSTFTFTPELNFYYAEPNLRFQSWQPVYLAFGIKDFSETLDGITYMLFNRIGMTIDYDAGIALISLKANQFLPIYIGKEEHSINAGLLGTPAPSSSVVSSSKRISGGTFLSVTLKKSF